LINALGGIRVNVNTYVAIGGNKDRGILPDDQITPGPNKHLDGAEALWFARGRYGSDDYQRMDRQRCVINAIIRQANPANVLARYEDIAKASKTLVYTDMPQEVLPLMVDLSLRVKDGNVRSIVFRPGSGNFVSSDPDFEEMRRRVKVAIGETKKIKSKTTSPKPTPTETGTDEPTEEPDGEPTERPNETESEDVNDSCAYKPEVAATARPVR
jgi:anionic cell wall polymer biosynthesis LytR-Cps2A-Psr (LCP) family protein